MDAIEYETPVQISPLVCRITQENPGLMTGPGTNTYLVGRESIFVLDPGEDTDRHFEAVFEAVGSRRVYGIAPTHAHPDHWPLAPRLAKALETTTYGFKTHNGYEPEKTIGDGIAFNGGDWTLQAIHTPGHVSDHLSYMLPEERALFSGDHVMRWSTSVISLPDGNLNQYMSSLERVRQLEVDILYPAHGEPVRAVRERIDELLAHRRQRSSQILEALSHGINQVPEIVARVYSDVPANLHPVAQQSVLAHLEALIDSGRVEVVRRNRSPLKSLYDLVRG